jgi:hypothetical protein
VVPSVIIFVSMGLPHLAGIAYIMYDV